MAAPEIIKQLIDTFADNIDFYKSDQYNEAQLRQEFLDPFFRELGWDMDNRAGLAPQYRDVIHEASIKIGSSTKAPDYAFTIHGQYKFFLEAKKPAVNLRENVDPAYQLRRYGWSANLPVSILTDFEEFAIYDCRTRPKRNESAATSRIGYFKYSDYLEKWDELAATFSKDAILKGSFDKYTTDAKRHRGTETVDAAFLEEIENWRNLLARNLALRNPALSVRDLNFAVQKTIDRLIFLRICEDRGTEDYKRLRSLLNGKNIYPRLCEVFIQADERYNSGLFHFSDEKGRGTPDNVTPELKIDDKVLKDIISKLYYPESPYEFSVLPADILGQVYEQFLGKTIRLTPGHQAKIEEKPEVRKAGGVYYTPSYIVDYIVENTLGRLLDGDDPENPKPIPVSQAAEIKVLDPACGSGSFLIVAYQYLLDWHLRQYTADPDSDEPNPGKIKKHSRGKNPRIYQAPGGEWKLGTDERKRILLNNIHGVDIDSQAVEVTKLSLLLKVIEGESQQIQQRDWIRQRQRILPDLGGNIQCGNSLIGPDFYDNEQMLLLDDQTQYRINVFDWNSAFPAVMKRGGFDCVIGNPPYIRIQAMKGWAPDEAQWYKESYKSAARGNFDIYLCFIEKGLGILCADGKLGFIVPHKFFNAKYGENLRKLISEARHLEQIVHFGFKQVFEQATTYTCLLFLSKTPKKQVFVCKVSESEVLPQRKSAFEMVENSNFTSDEWNLYIGRDGKIVKRLLSENTDLESLAEIFVGVQTSADRVYQLDKESELIQSTITKHVLPLVSGTHVKRYQLYTDESFIIFPYNSYGSLLSEKQISNESPLVWQYLIENRKTLESRERGKFKDAEWYRFGRNQNIARQAQPKLCIPRLVERLHCAYDPNGSVVMDNVDVNGVVVRDEEKLDLLYLSGIINSQLMGWLFPYVSAPFRGGWYSANRQFLGQLPIRVIDFSNPNDVAKHDKMVGLVDRMLDLNKKKAAEKNPETLRRIEAQISATDGQIDRLVYELYELSEEEIALVEGWK